jgi:hypothetical protein
MNIQERYDEWLRKSSELARGLKLEIDFTSHVSGSGFSTYIQPVVEAVTTDTHEYMEIEGSVEFG